MRPYARLGNRFRQKSEVHMKRVLLFLLCMATISSTALADPLAPSADKTQQMVNELNVIIDQGERNRSADYRFINQLRELAERYDQPWNLPLLFDDFSDGELQHNPPWHGNADAFWVSRSAGLRSRLAPDDDMAAPAASRQQSQEEALLGAILGSLGNNHDPRHQQQIATNTPSRADLSTSLSLSNAFSITLQLADLGREHRGTFVWGPYTGQDLHSGYRLIYQAGLQPTLTLASYRQGLSSVIAIYDKGALLTDGGNHSIIWQRRGDGDMSVLLDGNVIIRARDRSYSNPFAGFVISNLGGDYAIRSISIFGARR